MDAEINRKENVLRNTEHRCLIAEIDNDSTWRTGQSNFALELWNIDIHYYALCTKVWRSLFYAKEVITPASL